MINFSDFALWLEEHVSYISCDGFYMLCMGLESGRESMSWDDIGKKMCYVMKLGEQAC